MHYVYTHFWKTYKTVVSTWDRNLSEWKKEATGNYQFYHAWLHLHNKSQLTTERQVAKIHSAEARKYKGQEKSKLYVAVLWKIMLPNMCLMTVKIIYKDKKGLWNTEKWEGLKPH